MKWKRWISLLLVLTLLAALLTACGTGTTSATSEAPTASETSEPAPAAPEQTEVASAVEPESEMESAAPETPEPQLEEVALPLFDETRTYTMWTMLPFFMNGLVSDMATDINNMKLLQENCNVKLEVTAVGDSVVSEQFNLMVSSGDYTDIISDGVSHYSKGYDAAITDDIIIDLYDLAKEYAPNYLYYLDTDPALRAALITDNGCLPTVATIYKEAGCENGGILIRGDWLKELGMETPETYDQLHDYVQACMEKYGAMSWRTAGATIPCTATATICMPAVIMSSTGTWFIPTSTTIIMTISGCWQTGIRTAPCIPTSSTCRWAPRISGLHPVSAR